MFTAPDEVDFLIDQLERHYLSNATVVPSPNLRFALLTDFADAPEEQMPEDEALLAHAQAGIEELNRSYGSSASFCLLHRSRRWNPKEDTWMGWERKRGKFMEFNRLILGDHDTTYTTQIGDVQALQGSRYVVTLDADTVMPQDSTPRLIATLAHPLNRAEFDEETGRVIAGYTVLQPRTEVKPTSVNVTLFTRVFAGDAGLDLYTLAVSDVYQDLFGEGAFVGKGIYDVGAFHRSLENRVPDNTLLSHDLFEGIHGRAGLVTDIVLYEDYPPGYLTYASREHRWVRGDWQLLPWLLPRVPARPSSDLLQDTASGGKGPGSGRGADDPQSTLRTGPLEDHRQSAAQPARTCIGSAFLGGLVVSARRPWLWTLVTVLISATPVITGLLTALTRVDPELGLSNSLAR